MSLETQGVCDKCSNSGSHEDLESIGRSVRLNEGAAGYTDYSFSQCKVCGSIWTQYRDQSPAGGGRYCKRLTDGLF